MSTLTMAIAWWYTDRGLTRAKKALLDVLEEPRCFDRKDLEKSVNWMFLVLPGYPGVSQCTGEVTGADASATVILHSKSFSQTHSSTSPLDSRAHLWPYPLELPLFLMITHPFFHPQAPH